MRSGAVNVPSNDCFTSGLAFDNTFNARRDAFGSYNRGIAQPTIWKSMARDTRAICTVSTAS